MEMQSYNSNSIWNKEVAWSTCWLSKYVLYTRETRGQRGVADQVPGGAPSHVTVREYS